MPALRRVHRSPVLPDPGSRPDGSHVALSSARGLAAIGVLVGTSIILAFGAISWLDRLDSAAPTPPAREPLATAEPERGPGVVVPRVAEPSVAPSSRAPDKTASLGRPVIPPPEPPPDLLVPALPPAQSAAPPAVTSTTIATPTQSATAAGSVRPNDPARMIDAIVPRALPPIPASVSAAAGSDLSLPEPSSVARREVVDALGVQGPPRADRVAPRATRPARTATTRRSETTGSVPAARSRPARPRSEPPAPALAPFSLPGALRPGNS